MKQLVNRVLSVFIIWCLFIATINLSCSFFPHEVADADRTVKNLEKETDRLMDKLKPIKQLQDNLGKNISQIKELINQARKQANSVSCVFFLQRLYCFLPIIF